MRLIIFRVDSVGHGNKTSEDAVFALTYAGGLIFILEVLPTELVRRRLKLAWFFRTRDTKIKSPWVFLFTRENIWRRLTRSSQSKELWSFANLVVSFWWHSQRGRVNVPGRSTSNADEWERTTRTMTRTVSALLTTLQHIRLVVHLPSVRKGFEKNDVLEFVLRINRGSWLASFMTLQSKICLRMRN